MAGSEVYDSVTSSRDADQTEILNLRATENLIFVELTDNHDKTTGTKLLELAQIIEKRIERLDCEIPVYEISKYITRNLRQLGAKIAPWVSEYLPDKYKDPRLSQWGKLAHTYHEISIGSVLPSLPLEQLSNGELESFAEILEKLKNEGDKAGTLFNNLKDDVRREALARGMTKLGEEKLRDQISARDYRYEIPDYFGLKELNEEVVFQGNRGLKARSKFINEKYVECPATVRQDAFKYAHALRVDANLWESVVEDKWSGEEEFWFDREYWKEVQSSHKAGNSTMFPTTLCARCSANIEEDPKDFHRMKYWRPSPTGYICDCCGGTEVLPRENSREQVGDKSQRVLRDAADLLNHMVDYPDIAIDWRKRYKNPEIYARKKAISNKFRIAAFGKEDLVVPRKKVAK